MKMGLSQGPKTDIITNISEFTQILEAVTRGEATAATELLPLVYEELRKLAAAKLAHEAAGNTLQPTALVHEAWMRLAGDDEPTFQNRSHFFAAAAEAMRRILIDNARRKRAARHGGGLKRVNFDQIDLAAAGVEDQLLAVDEALDKLAAQHPVHAELVKLRYFVGMTVQQAATVLNISADTAKEYSAYSRAWLYRSLTRKEDN